MSEDTSENLLKSIVINNINNNELLEYSKNYKIATIIKSVWWNEDNAIYCNLCFAQVNYWSNPYDYNIFDIDNYHKYNDLLEKQYNNLTENYKLLYKKCKNCYMYRKIDSSKVELKECCEQRHVFEFKNGRIFKNI